MSRSRAIAALLLAVAAPPARAQTVPDGFSVQIVAPALDHPVAFDFLPGDRVMFAEQLSGNLRLLVHGQLAPGTVVTVPGLIEGGELGLLGVAVDPGFPARPYVYVHYDVISPRHIRVARFTLSGDLAGTGDGLLTADPASRYDLLDDVPDVNGNHNGGTLRFGPDGMLYDSVGEDGVPCAAQDTTSLGGKILRLDVSRLPEGPGSAPRALVTPADNPLVALPDSNARLVAALGLRNPFRFQIDPVRRWLVIGDVGEDSFEELDLLATPGGAAGAAAPGANFGWPFLEGDSTGAHALECPPGASTLTSPIFVYDRRSQPAGAAIISAGAYRPVAGRWESWPAEYDGDLFASDYFTGVLRRLTFANGAWDLAPPVPGQSDATAWGTGFNEVPDYRVGPDGALWFCRQSMNYSTQPGLGSIRRVVHGNPPVPSPGSLPSRPVLVPRPLPAPGAVTVAISLPVAGPVRLRIHGLDGRLVRTVEAGVVHPEGWSGAYWDGLDDRGHAVHPGVYVARLEAGGAEVSRTVPVLR